MPSSPAFGCEQLVTELLRGLIDAVAERPGETEAQRLARHQTAVFTTMAFLPRDALETMLATQCVMLDNLIRDGTRDLLLGRDERVKLRIRTQLIAMGRLFLRHLLELRRLQTRPAEQIAALARPASDESPDTAPVRDAASGPAATSPPAGKDALIQRRGFQNRRQRRAMQFKKPAGRSAAPPPPDPGTGRT